MTGSGVLQWRIRDETMSLATLLYSSISDLTSFGPFPNTPDFSTDLSSKSPLTSNISFTVQSNIDGYTVVCEDGNVNENCTISIEGTF